MVCVWAWTCLVGVVACGGSLTGVDPLLVGLALLSMLPFALVPLAIAFLLARSWDSPNRHSTRVGNIGAMVLSFLGGAWVPLALLPRRAGRGSPLALVLGLERRGGRAWCERRHACPSRRGEGTSVGIVALFAVAICAAGLAVGRARRRVAGAA